MKKFTLLSTLLLGAQVFAQTFTFTTYTPSGALTEPISITQAPGDDRLYVVERSGTIRIVNTDGSMVAGDWLDISGRVYDNNNEQGLLGLAFDPDYQTNGYFYVNYTIDTTGNTGIDGDTRISRFSRSTINPLIADPASEVKILCVKQPYWNHNGGGLNFGPDGYLYCGFGDGGSGGDPQNRAQNTDTLLGKMLRLNVDAPTYTSPVSNPFYGQANHRNEIWAIGVRNPWRFNFDRLSGDLWIGDVGQDTHEEIDHQMYGTGDAGLNYGWRCYEGAFTYNTSGCGPIANYTMPVADIPQASGPMCSITMGEVYRGAMYGEIYNKMIFTDYCNDYFWTLTYDTATSTYDTTRHNQMSGTQYLVTIVQDNRGFLYAANLTNNRIYKIGVVNCTPAAIIETPANRTVTCDAQPIQLKSAPGIGLTYQWLYNGAPLVGETDSIYSATLPGNYQLIVTNASCGLNPTDTSAVLTLGASTTPIVSLNSTTNDSICLTGGNLTLVGSPAGGDYVSPYVNAAGIFYTSVAGLGNHNITYQYTNAAGCTGTAILPINVNSGPVVTLNLSIDSVCSGSGSVTLSGGSPAGGTFSGTGVSGGNFDPSALSAGTYNIIYTYTDGGGCTNSDTNSVLVSGCLGLEDLSFNDILLYPNPADEIVNLSISSNINAQFSMNIITVDGKAVEQRNIQVVNGINNFVINTSNYASGVYFVQLNDGTHHFTKKIVIR